ncbi:hypothetical protein C4556_00880 [Candidatus Parcubacteria bacterium]|nr:MAG: hypothetical protein C4556_00880 [Candidatus Parcubacteria bacterium]
MKRAKRNGFLQDIGIIALSVVVSVLLAKTDVIVNLLASSEKLEYLGTFVAGMFFTSIFTTAPAIATLGELSLLHGILPTALVGALGSVAGDLLIFRFIRDRFSDHITELLGHKKVLRRFHTLFKRRVFYWFTFLLGGIVLASPLPDELGISLLGLSKTKMMYFIAMSYVFNVLGIFAIGIIAANL